LPELDLRENNKNNVPHNRQDFTLLFILFVCLQWQAGENAELDSDPLHWDHAVILTGLDVHVVDKNGKIASQVSAGGAGFESWIIKCFFHPLDPDPRFGRLFPDSGSSTFFSGIILHYFRIVIKEPKIFSYLYFS
jgi:hypothetical protein